MYKWQKFHKITSVGMGAAKGNETRYIGMAMSEFQHMTTSFFMLHTSLLINDQLCVGGHNLFYTLKT